MIVLFFPIYILECYYLIALNIVCNKVLNDSGDSGHSRPLADFNGNDGSAFPLY